MSDNPKITITLTKDEWFSVLNHLSDSSFHYKNEADKIRKHIDMSDGFSVDGLRKVEKNRRELSEEAKGLEEKIRDLMYEDRKAKRRKVNEASNS